MNFDKLTERRGTGCNKWDKAQKLYNVPDDCLPMWVADTDFELPDFVLDAGRRMLDHGILGYGFDNDAYLASTAWWLDSRHGWSPDPSDIFTANGLCNAIALCLDTFTDPGDGVIVFTPVYPEFESTVTGANRRLVQSEMVLDGERYVMDLDALEEQLQGDEKAVLFCSPHNPVGRVWDRAELDALAEFVRRHDLLLMSDEIHQDLVYPGANHTPLTLIDDLSERLIMLTAVTKTFPMPGMRVGNIIINDPTLRQAMAARFRALKFQPTTMGPALATAAQTPEGSQWADALVAYLDGNRKAFADGIGSIPGLRMTPIEATFLAWVDFSGTGMTTEEFTARVERDAGIAANRGVTFGPGGEQFLRFNLGTQRTRIEEALSRLSRAFGDLQ
ncbi:MAG: PatB family C-S lyase [Pseudomonadota bacterium]